MKTNRSRASRRREERQAEASASPLTVPILDRRHQTARGIVAAACGAAAVAASLISKKRDVVSLIVLHADKHRVAQTPKGAITLYQ
jgi:hypothetical protein